MKKEKMKIIICIIVLLIVIWIIWETNTIVVTRMEYKNSKISDEFDGYKLVGG